MVFQPIPHEVAQKSLCRSNLMMLLSCWKPYLGCPWAWIKPTYHHSEESKRADSCLYVSSHITALCQLFSYLESWHLSVSNMCHGSVPFSSCVSCVCLLHTDTHTHTELRIIFLTLLFQADPNRLIPSQKSLPSLSIFTFFSKISPLPQPLLNATLLHLFGPRTSLTLALSYIHMFTHSGFHNLFYSNFGCNSL